MANEIRVNLARQVINGNIQYSSRPPFYQADQKTAFGPAPGTVFIPVAGVDIDLSKFVRAGVARIQNLDTTHYVTYGPREIGINEFHPFGELGPGEQAHFRISR